MSSLYLKNITNLVIEMDIFEPPILDGSSIEFIDSINKAGVKKQNKEISPIVINRKISYEIPSKDSYLIALPYEGFKITYIIDYPSCDEIMNEEFSINLEFGNENNYKNVASARTFCLASELLALNKRGILKGANLDNGIVYIDKDIKESKNSNNFSVLCYL